MQNNVFLRLAQERYTTKHYNGQQIPREEFDTLLEILRLTPTSVNAQALHYFTATSQEARERLLPAFPEFNRDRITGASDVVVFTVPKTLTEAHLRRVLDKEESDGRFPNAEVKNAQDQGRRYFAGLHHGSEAELVAWEARQAYSAWGSCSSPQPAWASTRRRSKALIFRSSMKFSGLTRRI
ncbi:nitroreductase family protein [Sutterella wadsworthensis]|uniref:nitroreductase family protein n=1 Tax=Sutterella wadsworthensis TaxID=40545 RepID=UPI0030795067